MTTRTPPTESHAIHVAWLIRHAEEQLELGDRIQAAEKAWGAVAHRLEVIADYRGWRYETHTDAHRIARAIYNETGNPKIRQLYVIANFLHVNFYKDTMDLETLRDALDDVKELLGMLDSVE